MLCFFLDRSVPHSEKSDDAEKKKEKEKTSKRAREETFAPRFPQQLLLFRFFPGAYKRDVAMTEIHGQLQRRVHHPATGSLTPSLFIAVATIARYGFFPSLFEPFVATTLACVVSFYKRVSINAFYSQRTTDSS